MLCCSRLAHSRLELSILIFKMTLHDSTSSRLLRCEKIQTGHVLFDFSKALLASEHWLFRRVPANDQDRQAPARFSQSTIGFVETGKHFSNSLYDSSSLTVLSPNRRSFPKIKYHRLIIRNLLSIFIDVIEERRAASSSRNNFVSRTIS